MEVEANNFTACNLAQKLICLEDVHIEGGKFVVLYASAESVTDKRFLQSQRRTLVSVAAVVCLCRR